MQGEEDSDDNIQMAYLTFFIQIIQKSSIYKYLYLYYVRVCLFFKDIQLLTGGSGWHNDKILFFYVGFHGFSKCLTKKGWYFQDFCF